MLPVMHKVPLLTKKLHAFSMALATSLAGSGLSPTYAFTMVIRHAALMSPLLKGHWILRVLLNSSQVFADQG